jgi:transcriptional regulator
MRVRAIKRLMLPCRNPPPLGVGSFRGQPIWGRAGAGQKTGTPLPLQLVLPTEPNTGYAEGMYTPHYATMQDEAELYALMQQFSFATLVSCDAHGLPTASHVPFFIQPGVLRTHLAKANPQWQGIEHREVLVIFQGDHAYISPRYYQSDHRVPTWNYQAVHAYGVASIVGEDEAKRHMLAELSTHHEAGAHSPWTMSQLSEDSIQAHLNALVVIDVHITTLKGAWKLGQNGPTPDRLSAATSLQASTHPTERALGRAMQATLTLDTIKEQQ